MKQRLFLAVSSFVNVALLATVLWLPRKSSPPMTETTLAPWEAAANVPAKASQPFRWQQLESADYPTYIANLRAIGCPEQTVREIVSADVVDLFAPRRDPFLAKLTSPAATAFERSQAEQGLSQLRQEEAALIRKLFGIPEPDGPGGTLPVQVAGTPSPVRSPRPAVEDTNVVVPLVFQSVDTNAVGLGADQLQIINEVRQSFLSELGPNEDFNSPEYLRRWQLAQKQADNLLDGLLGRQLTLKYRAQLENQSAGSEN